MAFTKLVPEIIESSIWNEPPEIRVVWITMLAKKNNETGYVRGDARTIARLANVPIEVCERALELFQQPDPTSHTPDNEGRRIAPADGGWTILNNDKYVEYGMRVDQQEIWREQKRLQRAKKQQMSTECPGQVLDKSRNTLDLVSSSSSPEGIGEPKEPNPSLIALECHQAFKNPPKFAAARVIGNVAELLASGYAPDQIREAIRRSRKLGKWGPQSADSLTDPAKFQKWLTAEPEQNDRPRMAI